MIPRKFVVLRIREFVYFWKAHAMITSMRIIRKRRRSEHEYESTSPDFSAQNIILLQYSFQWKKYSNIYGVFSFSKQRILNGS